MAESDFLAMSNSLRMAEKALCDALEHIKDAKLHAYSAGTDSNWTMTMADVTDDCRYMEGTVRRFVAVVSRMRKHWEP